MKAMSQRKKVDGNQQKSDEWFAIKVGQNDDKLTGRKF